MKVGKQRKTAKEYSFDKTPHKLNRVKIIPANHINWKMNPKVNPNPIFLLAIAAAYLKMVNLFLNSSFLLIGNGLKLDFNPYPSFSFTLELVDFFKYSFKLWVTISVFLPP